MLAELDRLRALQAAQGEALEAGDIDRLDALHAERLALQAGLDRRVLTALEPHERGRAEALIARIGHEQEALSARAAGAADALGAGLRRVRTGRSALSGYRPASGGGSLLLDRSG